MLTHFAETFQTGQTDKRLLHFIFSLSEVPRDIVIVVFESLHFKPNFVCNLGRFIIVQIYMCHHEQKKKKILLDPKFAFNRK